MRSVVVNGRITARSKHAPVDAGSERTREDPDCVGSARPFENIRLLAALRDRRLKP
jgi:hypothetical protein